MAHPPQFLPFSARLRARVCQAVWLVFVLTLPTFAQNTPAPGRPDSLPTTPASSLAPAPAIGRDGVPVQANNRLALAPTDTATAIPVDTVKPQLRPSPVALALYKDESNYIKVVYGQPFKKGRTVFGSLEKWGQVWRAGANEATEITFTRDVKLDGKVLRAGTYTLFMIPNPDRWTVILNTDLGQWGAYNYKPEKDIMRFDVRVGKNSQIFEALTYKFNEIPTGTELSLMWDDVRVAIPIQFSR